MAEDLIVGGAGEIVNRLISLAVEEIGLVIGVKDEVKNLRNVLTNIQAVLQDAEKKQVEQQMVKVWLHDLKQVAYDAEDLLDEIAYKELKYTIITKAFRWFSPSRLIVRVKMAHQIRTINKELDAIDKRKKMFQLESTDQCGSSSLGQMITCERETCAYVKDSNVIGRESDKEAIIRMLINDDGSCSNTDRDQVSTGNNIPLPIIAIVGLGGLGKTTLAQLVYNNEAVKKHFELKVWICVSTNFRTTNLFFQIIQQINRNNTISESSSKQVLLDELKSQLEQQGTKKFLLVLDDDWNENPKEWEEFILPLGDFVARGSKIIVTSRDRNVASVKGAQSVYELEGLSQDSCWDLIESQAFKQGGPPKTPELVKIGKIISEKCKGVPLAAKVLGGLLQSKKEQEWLAVQNAEFWNLTSNDGNQIMEVLKLSYYNLPSTLKPCFYYCAIFPKDYWISKEVLIELWMAQGLLGASNIPGETMEGIGNNYFNILYLKSFFQEADMNQYGEVTHCKMHDLVNDLAQSICEFECQNLGESNGMSVNLSKCRHAAFISPKTIEALHGAKKLRTIFGWESDSNKEFDNGGTVRATKISTFFKFKLLRALDLSGFRGFDLSSLGEFKHLRYLDLSETSIKSLPKWVTRLYNLQTLKLIKCRMLIELPEDLMSLKKLRHLFIDDYEKWEKMPQAIGKLHQLQTLPLFVACEKNGISALENLNNLGGTLDIHRLCLVKEASLAKGGNLIDKGKLRKLGLHWDSDDGHDSCVGDDCDDLQVLKELQPHPNLKELSIEGLRRVEFPGWVSNGLLLPNIVAIEISNCSERKQIPSFGELPCLKRLKIKDIRSLEEWAEGNDVIGMFPCLEELEMYNCRNLRRAPHSFPSLKSLIFWNVGGIGVVSITTSLTSLTYLSIRECEDLEFLPEGLLRNNMQLDVVSVDNCPKLQAFREEGLLLTTTNDDDDDMEFPNSSLLRELNIRECNALKCIPDVRGFTSLQRLEIWQCRELETIPKGFLSSLVALESLRVSGFDRLKGTIELSPRLKHLREVQIHRCPNFEGLEISSSSSSSSSSTEQQLQQQQQQLVLFPNYHALEIMHCHAISSIDVGGFASLRELAIKYCGGLQALEGLPFLTALKKLEIGPFSEDLDCFPLLLLGGDDDDNGEVMTLNPPLLPSLRELTISGWPALQSLPRQLHHLTMLKSLFISDFPNLSALPEWLGNLASLESLEIWECENLTYLPSKEQMQRLTLLKELRIFYCPRLEERFCSDVSEWPKISHIPYVNITGNIMKRTFTGQNFHL